MVVNLASALPFRNKHASLYSFCLKGTRIVVGPLISAHACLVEARLTEKVDGGNLAARSIPKVL